MKVFISVDMEGVTGITDPEDVLPEGADYERGRVFMTGDANAAILGAYEAGATEVLVNDSHWTMRNLLLERLDPRARLIKGFQKPMCMVQGSTPPSMRRCSSGITRAPVPSTVCSTTRCWARRCRISCLTGSRSARLASTRWSRGSSGCRSRSWPAMTRCAVRRSGFSAPTCRRSRSRTGSTCSSPPVCTPRSPPPVSGRASRAGCAISGRVARTSSMVRSHGDHAERGDAGHRHPVAVGAAGRTAGDL